VGRRRWRANGRLARLHWWTGQRERAEEHVTTTRATDAESRADVPAEVTVRLRAEHGVDRSL
jgi:hypothetical protein